MEQSDDKLIKQLDDELIKQSDDELIKQSDEKLIEQSDEKNENTTDWYNKHKFKKILATVKINKFSHKNKIGKLKFNGINNLINKIKNNTISEAHAK